METFLKQGVNDLQTVKPELAKEWHREKNGELRPADVCAFSGKKVWWFAEAERFGKKFVLEWQATVANRSMGSGCPFTSKPPRKLMSGFNDLASTNPEVAGMWHENRNGETGPEMIFEHTNKKYWWSHTVYRHGKLFVHEWEAAPGAVKVGSCPYCHGNRLQKGFNDLASVCPETAEEWDEEKNGKLLPEDIIAGSNQKAFWKCGKCGHRWSAIINNRTRGVGCPRCSLRYGTSFPEQALYFYLKRTAPEIRSRDRETLDGLELDIYMPDMKTAVEYNGLWAHQAQDRKITDQKKRLLCEEKGILLIRVCENKQTTRYFPKRHLIQCVEDSQYSHLEFVISCISRELMGAGFLKKPIDIDINRDRQEIYTQYMQWIKEKSLGENYPHLMKEWDYDKNAGLSPYFVFPHGGTVVYWKHHVNKEGVTFTHSWSSSVSARTSSSRGCPVCAGKRVQIGFNDFASAAPELLREWDYERNSDLRPEQVTVWSKKKVWWKHVYGKGRNKGVHSWRAPVGSRVGGNGCPICDGKVIQSGYNDIATTYPELMEEWDHTRNHYKPTEISYGFDKKVWWKHTVTKNGKEVLHSWQASPNSRTNCQSGCPYCANKKALRGYNDLASEFPELGEKWDVKKNAPLTAQQVTSGSGKKVWWLDRKSPVSVADRTKYLKKPAGQRTVVSAKIL